MKNRLFDLNNHLFSQLERLTEGLLAWLRFQNDSDPADELHASIAGSRNHFHMACKGGCGMSMME